MKEQFSNFRAGGVAHEVVNFVKVRSVGEGRFNDRGSERLALGWHTVAAFISAGELFFSIASAFAALDVAPLIPVARNFFWFALAAAVVGFFCLAWHVRAVREHLVHLDELTALEPCFASSVVSSSHGCARGTPRCIAEHGKGGRA